VGLQLGMRNVAEAEMRLVSARDLTRVVVWPRSDSRMIPLKSLGVVDGHFIP
jgi:hypothetical protein